MLSRKAQYAFRALSHLVNKYEEGPVLISEISKKKRIPLKFLENILLELKRAGVLDSKKGKGGGYFIKADPAKTTVASVIRIVDGPIAMLPCVSLNFYERCSNCDEKNCGLHDIMENVRDATLAVLEKRSLQDLATGKEKI
ncbi:MAG TPA: Rrf2 family transcriptional regulator [Flavisolibacter sp.]|nr:Rrf2 family transcriptional regulator [Flavisolibacter sp.]